MKARALCLSAVALALSACTSSDSYDSGNKGGPPGTFHARADGRTMVLSEYLAEGCDKSRDNGFIIEDTVKTGDSETISYTVVSPFATRKWTTKTVVDSRSDTSASLTDTVEKHLFNGQDSTSKSMVQKRACQNNGSGPLAAWTCNQTGEAPPRYEFSCVFTNPGVSSRQTTHPTLYQYSLQDSASVRQGEYQFANNSRGQAILVEGKTYGSYECRDMSGKVVATGMGDRTVNLVIAPGLKPLTSIGLVCGGAIVRAEVTIRSNEGPVVHTDLVDTTSPLR